MRILSCFILATVLHASVAAASADDVASTQQSDITTAPSFYYLGTTGSNSVMSMQCFGEAPFQEIDCSFSQILVNTRPPETIKENKKSAADELQNMKPSEIQKLKVELQPPADFEKVFEEKFKNATAAQKGYAQDSKSLLQPLFKAKDKASINRILDSLEDKEAATCFIATNTFDFHFTRVSKNKWLYNPGPTGLCNVVRIATLENSDENLERWTFTQTTVTADNKPACKQWVDVGNTTIASWDAPNAFKFDCKYIKFGW